jgi:dihydroflavonol-4-reductase
MILVTGANGFLGRSLVRYLSASGLRVRALYHNRAPSKDLMSLPGVEWMRCDLLDIFEVEEAMKDIADVYHCAAIVSFDPARRKEMLHFNPESTANIVNQALQQNVRKMAHVSSVAALGRTGADKQMTEEEEWSENRYNSAYAISKYLAENEVWRGIGEGLKAVIVNPGIMLGSCESHDPPVQLLKAAYNEFPFYTKGVNSWVDVADVVKALVMLMNSDVEAERFIISGGNHAYREIFTLMANAFNKKPPVYFANTFMAGVAWRWSWLKSKLSGTTALLSRETANNANIFSYYNNEKLTRFLPGFTYTPVHQSIAVMAQSFMNSNKN